MTLGGWAKAEEYDPVGLSLWRELLMEGLHPGVGGWALVVAATRRVARLGGIGQPGGW